MSVLGRPEGQGGKGSHSRHASSSRAGGERETQGELARGFRGGSGIQRAGALCELEGSVGGRGD